uniref:5-hmdU DNA kinase helical domain-containing protein n=1 Tax=Chrysotila carterae TaxID=13221 RepID=A0A7S4C374_CHRCT|mmetsp:Transcript_39478/g.86757  ORF Transcript_39478/g.86757 Transcript_39478/m.86757 type:complete len:337 (+) Transcript_39478:99-1109(+)|eukprot:6204406-Pleurochrysis_carterae.AAC.5
MGCRRKAQRHGDHPLAMAVANPNVIAKTPSACLRVRKMPISNVKPSQMASKLNFVDFCTARQAILLNRRKGLPRDQWTTDNILATAKFCNIDRRDDAVTTELLAEVQAHVHWVLREKVLLAMALRFSGSRRGGAAQLAALIESGRNERGKGTQTPLQRAFAAEEVKCGHNTYQLSLNRKQVSTVIETAADAVIAYVETNGPFADVLDASDFVAEQMTVGKRPQFSANEAAKDFAYFAPGRLMLPASHHRCRLGPGAKKGLQLVRASEGDDLGIRCCTEDAAVTALWLELRGVPLLAWVETIDVEQALCEFSKYEAYRLNGISASKTFIPAYSTRCK